LLLHLERSMMRNIAVEWAALLHRATEVPGLFGPETDCTDCGFCAFSQFLQMNAGLTVQIRLRSLPSMHSVRMLCLRFLLQFHLVKALNGERPCSTKIKSVAWVRERTMPTERPPLLGEVVPIFADRGCCVVSATDSPGR
jgi:hypothetical protein